MKNFAYYLLLILIPFSANCSNEKDIHNQQITNLVAFTKSYGYIRYFHPLNESSKIDWNKFLLYGISKTVYCKNNDELRDSLTQLFRPISDRARFLSYKPVANEGQTYRSTDTLFFHQYRGIKTSDLSYLPFKDYQVKISNNSFIDSSLFSTIPNYHENYCIQLIPNLFINFPVVTRKAINKWDVRDFDQQIINETRLQLTKEQIKSLADIITFWNIVQHFYPYHTESGMNWEYTLKSIIEKVLNDPHDYNADKYIYMLGKEMRDGHFRVESNLKKGFYLPINLRLLDSIPIVIESFDTTIFKKGDVLRTINHKPVAFLIDSVKSYWSGSDEFVNSWSINNIHRSQNSDEVTVELLRGKRVLSLSVKRAYFNRKPKSSFLDNEIYYCNLSDANCNIDTLINIASKKYALILDWRNGSNMLLVHKLFQHLTDDTLPPPFKFMIPQLVYPDHKFDTYYEPEQFVTPLKPRIRTKIVILSSPSNMSYQESIIKMAQLYNLSTIVGETTGGVEGSINYSTLPSGLVVGWTGMKVINLDGSQHHIIGIKPNVLITPTLEGLKAGKDEVLDKALEYLRTD